MHLWQIRHIPNRPQSLLKLTFSLAVFAGVAITPFAPVRFVAGQAVENETKKVETDSKGSEAKEFLDRVRQELPKHRSVKADLTQVVSIGEQQFKVAGQYISAGSKLRLTYTLTPDQGARGEMLEVCDGKELWTMMNLPPDPKRVTHRNVEQILAAAVAANQQGVAESTTAVELGLGGLVALLASLDRTMNFDAIKQEESSGHSRTVIQGRWKKEILQGYQQRFATDKDGSLPLFIPDLVRLYANSETLIPERILYLKKHVTKEKKAYRPLVDLQFQNIELNEPVDESTFAFDFAGDIVPEDTTKMYLDRLKIPTDIPREKK